MPGLEDLYRQIILDHYRNVRNRGTLPPPAHRVEGFNPLCGDELVLTALIEDDIVTDVAVETTGCSISQASASLMTTAIKGKPIAEVRKVIGAFKHLLSIDDGQEAEDVNLGDLSALGGVAKYPVRIKCATLAWNALAQALDEPASASSVTTE